MRPCKDKGYRWKWWRGATWNLSMTVRLEDGDVVVGGGDDGRNGGDTYRTLVFSFHGAWRELLRRTFDRIAPGMSDGYEIQLERMPVMLNGKCPYQHNVVVRRADLHLLSPDGWVLLVFRTMTQLLRCRIRFIRDYDKFLNL